MSSAASVARRRFSPRVEWWALWLMGCGGGVVFVEPSPYELAFALAFLVFIVGGLRMGAGAVVLITLLMIFNTGGLFSLIPFLHDGDAVMFIAISYYLAITAVFIAAVIQNDSDARLHALKWGCVCGAVIASSAGVLGYFNVAGLGSVFTLFGRASGTFKDPNVLGTFVILPLVLLTQDILTSRRLRPGVLAAFAIILFGGVFLSFSRGAWGHAVFSIALTVGLTFLLTAGARLRRRIVMLSIAGVGVLATGLLALLSIEEVGAMFQDRASLTQAYDIGETGRFGRYSRALPELLDRPAGYGPLQFRHFWLEDPHNVYLNAFSSYGWLGGVAYLTLIVATLVVGWRSVAMAGPTQPFAIAVWSTLFVQILQGFTIDTDHWRHFYLLLGLTWGLFDIGRRREAIHRDAARWKAGEPVRNPGSRAIVTADLR
ncbi:MAG: O-antigen ligase domain-containing protein [Salinarimonadaceae bacterium]|nr:MAG: O-antigen ligase domain-containing protein [Salinarimonadaceae bacterium]